jgi:hypothetical protein
VLSTAQSAPPLIELYNVVNSDMTGSVAYHNCGTRHVSCTQIHPHTVLIHTPTHSKKK